MDSATEVSGEGFARFGKFFKFQKIFCEISAISFLTKLQTSIGDNSTENDVLTKIYRSKRQDLYLNTDINVNAVAEISIWTI